MNQLAQITNVIRQAVKESTNKNMSLQSAKALAAKIMGERNMHAVSTKENVTTAAGQDGFTWCVNSHYDDNQQPHSEIVRATDGFSALLEVALRAKMEAEESGDDVIDLVLHSAINPFTGQVAYPSDESHFGTFVEDLFEHLEGYVPFSETHPHLPQSGELKQHPNGGYVVTVEANVEKTDFVYVDGMGDAALVDQLKKAFDAPTERSALEKEFARIDAMDHWEDDPLYSSEQWSHLVACNDTRQSYKDWVKSQYEMNQDD